MFRRWVRTLFRGGGEVGATDVYVLGVSSKPAKDTSPDQFLDSYVSFCNDFADRMRSTVVSHQK